MKANSHKVSQFLRSLNGVSATTRLQFTKNFIGKNNTELCDAYHIETSCSVIYDGFWRLRSYALEIMYGAGLPSSVSQNELELPQADEDGAEGTWFAAVDHVVVYLNKCDAFHTQVVLVCARQNVV
jgi:hypothetical protein